MALGPTFITDTLLVPSPEQDQQLQSTCVTEATARDTGVTTRTTSKGERFAFPGIPREDLFEECHYSESWRTDLSDGYTEGSYNVSLAGPVQAVMHVDPDGDYGRFVPAPGRTLMFTASVATGTARFRFELDPAGTSTFAGYASNAYVDDIFYAKFPALAHLKDSYLDTDPDVIFDREQFNAADWSRIDPQVVETARPQGAATVIVTAMDYGAVGRLRAFAKSDECGDWQPVTIQVGTSSAAFVAIPRDEDHNFMADAIAEYRGLDPDADADADPRGNGIAGDGLTAFEEYRGFLVRGADCGESAEALAEVSAAPSADPGGGTEHVRTPPHHKNVFVHADDPLLATLVPEFAWATGVSALAICEPGYGDNAYRVVNYTLHETGPRAWLGRALTLDQPQHGLWLHRVDETDTGGLGVALGNPADAMGPPKFTIEVQVAKPLWDPNLSRAARVYMGYPTLEDLLIATRHELSHAVGVPHHADDVVDWKILSGKLDVTPYFSVYQRPGGAPNLMQTVDEALKPQILMVEPGSACTRSDLDAAYEDEQQTAFVGCLTTEIVRRGQQTSGDVMCPMRYEGGGRYEPPGTETRFLSNRLVYYTYGNVKSAKVDLWSGNLPTYKSQYEVRPLDRLCRKPAGTGINALQGDLNHAGDAGRRRSCSDFVVVKDAAAR